jgi:hypothetical protein
MNDSALHDKIQGWVRERLMSPPDPGPDPGTDPLESNLVQVLKTARLTMEALNQFSDLIRVKDRNKYEFIEQRLGEIVTFEEFSLAEYSLQLPNEGTPGIRLWLTSEGFQRVLQVLYFPDVVQWRVNQDGGRVREIILEMELPPATQEIKGNPATSKVEGDWRRHLVRALILAAGRDPAEVSSFR